MRFECQAPNKICLALCSWPITTISFMQTNTDNPFTNAVFDHHFARQRRWPRRHCWPGPRTWHNRLAWRRRMMHKQLLMCSPPSALPTRQTRHTPDSRPNARNGPATRWGVRPCHAVRSAVLAGRAANCDGSSRPARRVERAVIAKASACSRVSAQTVKWPIFLPGRG